ncbi:hypothetical protein [Streptomyces sp. NBC_01334]|uniref:hypothetical protein n=1 Tax=Streptomyces sp. NBC_01334 TaxID=2903827 RepID=UPI002E1370A7|nr:hypothetical protein OG736_19460 [Streptomyces sp. NBC_01334]
MSRKKHRQAARANASLAAKGRSGGDALAGGVPQPRDGTPDGGRPPGTDPLPMWLRIVDIVVRVVDMALRLI